MWFLVFFQVNLLVSHKVTALVTQGLGNSAIYTPKYELLYGDDGYIWTNYTNSSGLTQVRLYLKPDLSIKMRSSEDN